MKITCAFQYELYVDETRRAALSRNAGCRRFVFNKALGIQNERKSKGEKLLTYKELAHELVLWKKQPETAFLREAMSQPLQQALLDRAISDSFRPKSDPAHKGWPKFKEALQKPLFPSRIEQNCSVRFFFTTSKKWCFLPSK